MLQKGFLSHLIPVKYFSSLVLARNLFFRNAKARKMLKLIPYASISFTDITFYLISIVIIRFSSYLQPLSLIQVLLSVFYRILRRKKQIEPWIQCKGTIHQIYREERRLAVCGEGAGCAQRAQKCTHGAKDTQGAESAEKHWKCKSTISAECVKYAECPILLQDKERAKRAQYAINDNPCIFSVWKISPKRATQNGLRPS